MSYIAECRDQNGNWTDEPMACNNARLIAAAPDLLTALQACVLVMASDLPPSAAQAELAQARAAINKATGAA